MMTIDAREGFALWFTGLPCSGKTTIARRIEAQLREAGLRVEVLDGDEIREHLSPKLGFTKEDRDTHIKRLAYVGKLLVRNGVTVLVAAISPYREARQYARRLIGRCLEVYVNCPVEVCIERDAKGLYKKALAGQISAFTGISDPYEPPNPPDLELRTDRQTPDESATIVLGELTRRGLIKM